MNGMYGLKQAGRLANEDLDHLLHALQTHYNISTNLKGVLTLASISNGITMRIL